MKAMKAANTAFATLIQVAQEVLLSTGIGGTTTDEMLHMASQMHQAKTGTSIPLGSGGKSLQEDLRDRDRSIVKRREAAVDELLRVASSLPSGELEDSWRSYLEIEHDRLLELSQVDTDKDGELTWSCQLQNVLNTAILVSSHPRGSEAVRKEMAYIAFARVAEARPANTPGWASAQINLGLASEERLRGHKAAQLEEGIRCYELATTVWTKHDFPLQWANTQRNLGVVHRKRKAGNRRDNL